MERDNLKLLNKMHSVRSAGFSYNERHASNAANGARAGGAGPPQRKGNHAINQRKVQDKIQKENQKIAMRLQSVKSSGVRGSGYGGGGGGGGRSRVSSGYGQQEPVRPPTVVKKQQQTKKRQQAPLVQPEWNDRP